MPFYRTINVFDWFQNHALMRTGGNHSIQLLIIVYVDDLLFCRTKTSTNDFLAAMTQRFKLKSKVLASEYIGISIEQKKDRIYLYQTKQISETFAMLNLQTTRNFLTPIELIDHVKMNQVCHEIDKFIKDWLGAKNTGIFVANPISPAPFGQWLRNQQLTLRDMNRVHRCMKCVYNTRNKSLCYVQSKPSESACKPTFMLITILQMLLIVDLETSLKLWWIAQLCIREVKWLQ